MNRYFAVIMFLSIVPVCGNAAEGNHKTSFNRLFTTQNQRLVLDRLREHYNPGKKSGYRTGDYTDKTVEIDTIPDRQLRLKGIVKRSNGRQSVWLGNRRFDIGPNSSGNIKVTQDKSPGARLKVPGKSLHIRLKPGQTYLIDSNRVMENFSVPETVVTKSKGKFRIKAK